MFPSFSAFCLVSTAKFNTQDGQGDTARAHLMRTYGLTPAETEGQPLRVHTSAAGLFCGPVPSAVVSSRGELDPVRSLLLLCRDWHKTL